MKNLTLPAIAFLAVLILTGCEKTFNGIVDEENPAYKVSQINSFSTFNYAVGDSLLPLRVTFLDDQGVINVFADIFDPDGGKLNSAAIILADNGKAENGDARANDKVYSGVFPLSHLYPNGIYSVHYFVSVKSETKEIAFHSFEYDNGQANVPPVLSDLVMPDSVIAGNTISFSVLASDSNGLNDIKSVFYEAFDPNGVKSVNSQGISQFPLLDDGNIRSDGDVTANDGVYSMILTFPATVKKGTWRFEFLAQDRRNALSGRLVHSIVVK